MINTPRLAALSFSAWPGYGGVLASFIDSSGEEKVHITLSDGDFEHSFSVKSSKIEMREEHPVQLFAGAEIALTRYDLGLRIESRFYDRTSLSVALFKQF